MSAPIPIVPPTIITGVIRSAESGEAVKQATVSVYTLAPTAGLVGRARTDGRGAYRIDWPAHWTMARDLYVVVLDGNGQLLQVNGNGVERLTGSSNARDYEVRRRWRPARDHRAADRM